MKPRLWKAHGRWWCKGKDDISGCGPTPASAYEAYCKNLLYYRRLMAVCTA